MRKKGTKTIQVGKTKRTTDVIIAEAVARQNSWMEQRRLMAKKFFKKLNIFKPTVENIEKKEIKAKIKKIAKEQNSISGKKKSILSYWFPITCAVFVLFALLWAVFVGGTSSEKVIIPTVPEPFAKSINSEIKQITPSFDIVRIEKEGNIIIAGRYLADKNVSVVMNRKVVSTQRTDSNGEFVYSPKHKFKAGNYTIGLVDADSGLKSENKVFVYVSEHGAKNSVSLLMTKTGSTILQSPKLMDGDLVVSKIDYMAGGRIVVSGNALPRLRVSVSLNNEYLGYAHVSDYKHFGLGADIAKLQPGTNYELSIRLHDGDGNVVDEVNHKFTMPVMTGSDNTFYTVRRGDCLWIIARNFLRKGILFSIIAEKNNIKNPDLIFPKQILKIPVKVK